MMIMSLLIRSQTVSCKRMRLTHSQPQDQPVSSQPQDQPVRNQLISSLQEEKYGIKKSELNGLLAQ
jgi:hypothetical protein